MWFGWLFFVSIVCEIVMLLVLFVCVCCVFVMIVEWVECSLFVLCLFDVVDWSVVCVVYVEFVLEWLGEVSV